MYYRAFACFIWLTTMVGAETILEGEDPDLPQPLDLSFAEEVAVHSPFTRSVNLAESLRLTGLAYINGQPVATVYNTATKESILVTPEMNPQGWHLAEAVAGADLAESRVVLMVGPEAVTMHYNGQTVAPMGGGSTPKNSKTTSKFSLASLLGSQGKQLYAELSPEGRSRFKSLIKSQQEKQPSLSAQQSADYARKVYAKVRQQDGAGSASRSSSPKPVKTKKKQGT